MNKKYNKPKPVVADFLANELHKRTEGKTDRISKLIALDLGKTIGAIDVTLDRIPIFGFIKNSVDFSHSIKNGHRKTEIYRFCASLGCTPFEVATIYSVFSGLDLSSAAIYFGASKIWYWVLYIIYLCKREGVDIITFIVKLKSDIKFNVKINRELERSRNNVLLSDLNESEEVTHSLFRKIKNFPKNFNLKKKL